MVDTYITYCAPMVEFILISYSKTVGDTAFFNVLLLFSLVVICPSFGPAVHFFSCIKYSTAYVLSFLDISLVSTSANVSIS